MIQEYHRRLYDYLKLYIAEYEQSPAYSEIAGYMKTTKFTAHRWTKELIEDGYLKQEPHEHRGLTLTRKKLP